MSNVRTSGTAAVILQSCMMTAALLVPFSARADALRLFNIGAQPLANALLEFSKQADQQIVGASEAIGAKWSAGVRGRLTNKEALEHLLSGTGLTFTSVDQRTIRIYAGTEGPTALVTQSRRSTVEAADEYRFAQDSSVAASGVQVPPSAFTDKTSLAAERVPEVLVTAQKKTERLQDVPVPVTVLSADVLAEQNENRLQDYFASVPGLSMAPVAPGMQNLSLRGVTTSVVGNPTVGVMIDDMPYGSSTLLGFGAVVLPDLDPNDLARVEVLRGPQGTLYGASSLGGLIKFVTRDPSTAGFNGQVQAGVNTVHNGDQAGYNVRGSVNVPLSDTLALRMSGFTRRDPGWITNVTTGEKGVNSADVYGGRLSALWQPTDRFSLKLGALVQKTEGNGTSAIDADASLKPIHGDLNQARQVKERYDSTVEYYTATLRFKLGELELASLSAYSKNKFFSLTDETPTLGGFSQQFFGVAGAQGADNFNDVTKFSQEFRLTSAPGQKYEWLLGAFYTHEDAKIDQYDAAVDLNTGIQAGIMGDYNFPTTLTERALFGDLTVHFTNRFSLQVGGRASDNFQHYSEVDTGLLIPFYYGMPSPVVTPPQRTDGTAFTYLLTPQWKLSPDTMLYARFTSGYRLGGNNIEAIVGQIPPSYQPDKTYNYEAGIKGALFNGTLSYDAAVYYTDWRNIQIYLYSPITFSGYNDNAGTAKTQGLELQFQARPVKGLTISAMFSLIDAELTEDFPSNAIFTAHSGDRLPYSPRTSGSLSVNQDIELGNSWTGFIGASATYQGERLGEFGSAFGTGARFHFPAYTTVDLHAGVRFSAWTVNLFVNNLTDERGVISARVNTYLLTNDLYYIQPRTVGLSVGRTF